MRSLRKAQSWGAERPVPTWMLSSGPALCQRGASGASHYLVKPFDPEILIALVERLVAATRIA